MMFISSLSAFPEFLLPFFSSSHNTIALSPLWQHVGESLDFHTLLPPHVPGYSYATSTSTPFMWYNMEQLE